jgi:hypothetical protein
VGTAALERADTRSWHLVPGEISLVRLRVPAGAHALSLEIPGPEADALRRVELGAVNVRAGGLTILTTRDWQ